ITPPGRPWRHGKSPSGFTTGFGIRRSGSLPDWLKRTEPAGTGLSCFRVSRARISSQESSMIREMLGIAEGILQDLHNDHNEVAALMERIGDSENSPERSALFKEMSTKLLAHAKAEQEVLYRRMENSPNEASRRFALEGTSEH